MLIGCLSVIVVSENPAITCAVHLILETGGSDFYAVSLRCRCPEKRHRNPQESPVVQLYGISWSFVSAEDIGIRSWAFGQTDGCMFWNNRIAQQQLNQITKGMERVWVLSSHIAPGQVTGFCEKRREVRQRQTGSRPHSIG